MEEESNLSDDNAGMSEEYVEYNEIDGGTRDSFGSKLKAFSMSPYWTISTIIFLLIIAFSLGRYMQLQAQKPAVKIISESESNKESNTMPTSTVQSIDVSASVLPSVNKAVSSQTNTASSNQPYTDGTVVASKNGTKYHFPWCPGAKQISAGNLITFKSIAEARKAGYSPAVNCKGLQ